MDFHLTNEQQMLRKMYREFAENEVKPLAEEIDEEERFPMETVEKMAKLGMMGIYFPKEYGGAGGDVLSYAMCVEELAKVCGTTAVIVSAHTSLCCAPIYENGTEEQKRKYLPDLLSGRKIGAFGLTEPNAGTDASGQQTTAVKNENGDYVLNGSKCFITNGNVADTFVVFAMTDKSKGNHGISAFIVEKSFPGFSTGKHEKKMGIRGSSTCDLIFEDCIVPTENVDRYIADPLCGADATVGLFRQMLHGIAFNQNPKNLARMDSSLPVLLISGDRDPVGDMGKGVRRTADAFRKAGLSDVTVKLYPGLRHEILNEGPMRQTVYEDIWHWLEPQLSAR